MYIASLGTYNVEKWEKNFVNQGGVLIIGLIIVNMINVINDDLFIAAER